MNLPTLIFSFFTPLTISQHPYLFRPDLDLLGWWLLAVFMEYCLVIFGIQVQENWRLL